MYLSFLFSGIYLASLFSISEFIFNPLNLYYELWWLDIPMHILGGFGVGWFFTSGLILLRKKHSIKVIVFLTLSIMVMWEVYEYLLDLNDLRSWIGWKDTIADVFNGFVGMTIFYKLFSKK